MTTATEKFHADIAAVMKLVGYVQKDGKNKHFDYKFASAETVLKKVNEELAARGICVSESNPSLEHFDGKNAVVRLSLTLSRGDCYVTAAGLGQGKDSGDKAVMKANTAAIKYALAGCFLISWGDDPEADSSTDSADDSKPQVKKTPKKAAPKYDLSKEQAELERLIEAAEGVGKMEKDIKPRIVKLKEHDESVYKALVKTYKAKQKSLKEAA